MLNLSLLFKSKEVLHGFTLEELKSHFAGVLVGPNEKIDMDIVQFASDDGFSFEPVSFPDIVLAMSHFSSQARGAIEIPQNVVVKSLIVALKKIATPSSVSDFRTIALQCFLSKVLEMFAHSQIISYLSRAGILDFFQAGFRQFHSIQTALLKLTAEEREDYHAHRTYSSDDNASPQLSASDFHDLMQKIGMDRSQ